MFMTQDFAIICEMYAAGLIQRDPRLSDEELSGFVVSGLAERHPPIMDEIKRRAAERTRIAALETALAAARVDRAALVAAERERQGAEQARRRALYLLEQRRVEIADRAAELAKERAELEAHVQRMEGQHAADAGVVPTPPPPLSAEDVEMLRRIDAKIAELKAEQSAPPAKGAAVAEGTDRFGWLGLMGGGAYGDRARAEANGDHDNNHDASASSNGDAA